jgi:DHA1 family tetracycline resistance protein-like MFS transporter
VTGLQIEAAPAVAGVVPVRRAALAFIFVTVALDMLSLGIIVPVLPKLVLAFEGGDSASAAAICGLFGTVYSAMQFVFAPLLGALSDRFGRRPVILLSNLALAVDYVIVALAPTVGWLFVGRVLSGICGASYTPAGAYIADVTPPERRAAGFGIISAAFGLGFVVGPALGGLAGSVNPRLPFWIAAGLGLANTLYGLLVLPESLPVERRAPFQWKRANPAGALMLLRSHAHVLGIAGVVFLAAIAHEVQPSLFVLYTDYRYGWDMRTVGLVLATLGVLSAVVGAGLVRVVVERLGERRTLLLGLASGACGFALYGLAPTTAVFFAGVPLVALWGLAGPAAQSLMTQQVDPTEQGQLQGAISGVQGVAFMIGPVLFTAVYAACIGTRTGWQLPGAPFLLAALLLATGFGLAWRVARR